ncbi:MAG: DUF362 domain-containing protein [Ignavibacteriaceae bacterium]
MNSQNILDCRLDPKVAIFSDENCKYSDVPPYHPNKIYPEYPFNTENINLLKEEKPDGYYAVREIFYLLGYDKENYNTKNWNPLGELIKPGQKVVIKPNFVLHINEGGFDIYASLTHPSVIRAVADYCLIALKGSGSLSIVENPQMDCDFEEIKKIMSLESISDFYRKVANFEFRILDTRRLKCKLNYDKGYYPADSFIINDNADPLGYAIIDIGKDSFLEGLEGIENLYGADFDRTFTVKNHTNGVHKYCVSKSILDADTVICIPKMKTHKMVGVTLNIKLLVGINGDKNYLAHFRVGSPGEKGDEFPDTKHKEVELKRKLFRWMQDNLLIKRTKYFDWIFLLVKRIGKYGQNLLIRLKLINKPRGDDKISGGNWYGNDTAWRMAADLSRILIYADREGIMHEEPQRKIFSIIDGIIAGEKDGPMAPMPKMIGSMVAGENILAVDTACATFMGFDYKKIKMLSELWNNTKRPLAFFNTDETNVVSNDNLLNNKNVKNCYKYKFLPHTNWLGEIENQFKI